MSFACRNLGREGVTLQRCVEPLFCLTGELGLCPVGALCLGPPHPAERGVQAEEVCLLCSLFGFSWLIPCELFLLWQKPFSEMQFRGFCSIPNPVFCPAAGVTMQRKRIADVAPRRGNPGSQPPPKLLPKHGDRACPRPSPFPCSL